MSYRNTVLLALAAMFVLAAETLDARNAATNSGGEPRVLYAYDGIITVCNDACDSIAAFNVDATLSGKFLIRSASPGSFAFSDIQHDGFEWHSDDAPEEPYDWQNPNPTSANPLQLRRIAGLRESVTSVGVTLETEITIDANGELSSGTLLYQLDVPPFSSDDAWLVFDIASGVAQLCVYFEELGCKAGATEAVVAAGAFSRLGQDSDEDGVPDSVDTCINDTNPQQIDSNGDGIGNVCDADIAGPGGPGQDDCIVDFFDLGRMKQVYFTNDPDADLVGPGNSEPDGTVAFFDLGRMKELFFQLPGPSATGCN